MLYQGVVNEHQRYYSALDFNEEYHWERKQTSDYTAVIMHDRGKKCLKMVLYLTDALFCHVCSDEDCYMFSETCGCRS